MQANNWAMLDEKRLENYIQNLSGKIVLGIDGFIDQVWQVVETRNTDNEYILIDRMQRFGEIIVNRKEGGLANELIKKRRSYGGFTANTGKVLGNLDLNTILLGMYGKEAIDKIFNELRKKCSLISIGDPVISNILEFSDGKIMMPNLDELLNLRWKDLEDAIGDEELQRIFTDVDIVSMGYWSNMPAFDEFISKLNENYFQDRYPKSFFFDFANIKKRSFEALNHTFQVLAEMNDKIPVSLSLNEHEAILLFSHYGREFIDNSEAVAASAAVIRNLTGLSEIIVHTPYYAVIASKSDGIGISIQDYCASPVITTGAGDTFNGGYIASCLGDLNVNERLAMANAATRFYICSGHAPDRDELLAEIKRIKNALG